MEWPASRYQRSLYIFNPICEEVCFRAKVSLNEDIALVINVIIYVV